MELTLQQIYDYNVCPLMYKFKHQMGINKEEVSLIKRYEDAVHKTVMFYYYQLLNEKKPSLEKVRQKFGSIFYKDMSIDDILADSTLDKNKNATNLQAMKILEAFYNREADKDSKIIAVDTDTRVQVKDHYVITNIDLVRETKIDDKDVLEVIYFTTTSRAADPFSVNHNLDLTAGVYAFRKLFKTMENRIILQYMRSGKEYVTIRKDAEMRKFEAIVENVGRAIQEERFHPVLNSRCNHCKYKDLCDRYKY